MISTIKVDNVEMYCINELLGEFDDNEFDNYLMNRREDFFIYLQCVGKYKIVRYTHMGFNKYNGAANDMIEDIYVTIEMFEDFKEWIENH